MKQNLEQKELESSAPAVATAGANPAGSKIKLRGGSRVRIPPSPFYVYEEAGYESLPIQFK